MSTTPTQLPPHEKQRLNDLMSVADRAGLIRLPSALEAKVMGIDAALGAKRSADIALVDSRTAHDDAVALAELAAGRAVRKEGAKTWIDGDGDPRQVSADEARAWVARIVAKDPDVIAAAGVLRAAELDAGAARDAVTVAERAYTAAKHALDASIEVVRLLEHAFTTTGSTR